MYVEFFDDIDTFYDQIFSFLVEREAENNIMFAILNSLKVNKTTYGEKAPLLIIIKEDNRIELVALQTPPFNLILSYTKNLYSIEVLIKDLTKRNIELPGVLGPKNEVNNFIDIWCKNKNFKPTLIRNERIYRLNKVTQGILGKRRVIRSNKEHQPLIINWAKDFIREALPNTPEEEINKVDKRIEVDIEQGKFFLLLENKIVVSMARKAGKTPNGNLVNYVYTPPILRRKGYATECVAFLSKRILDEGAQFCFLFTDLANPISNSIYQKIGYQAVIDVDQYEFIPKK